MAARKKPEEKSWEERVMQLEASATNLSEQLGATQAELSAAQAQLGAATAALEAHKQAEAARESQEFGAFLDDLKAQACEAGSPIDESDLEKVSATWNTGSKDLAKTLAGAFLDRSKALGQGSASGSTTQLVSVASTGEDSKTQADYAAETAARWARGKKG